MSKKQIFNPYLPSYEYIPDGEPHIFDGRVYLYGSHDRFGGDDYCLNDYVFLQRLCVLYGRLCMLVGARRRPFRLAV